MCRSVRGQDPEPHIVTGDYRLGCNQSVNETVTVQSWAFEEGWKSVIQVYFILTQDQKELTATFLDSRV